MPNEVVESGIKIETGYKPEPVATGSTDIRLPPPESVATKETLSGTKILFLQHRETPNAYKKFEESGILPPNTPLQDIDAIDFSQANTIAASLPCIIIKRDEVTGNYYFYKLEKQGDRITPVKSEHILPQTPNTPDVVIMHAPDPSFLEISREYAAVMTDFDANFTDQNRPTVILYTDGFEPKLYQKHEFQGALFCSTPQELQNSLALAENLRKLREKEESLKPKTLAPMQEAQYDASEDLREWEHKTADTYRSLKDILDRIKLRENILREYDKDKYIHPFDDEGWHMPKDDTLRPRRPIKTILDLGTGEGRIAGMLARLGLNVMGLDISQAILNRGRQRFIQEGEGLRGERNDPTLSYNALKHLINEGEVAIAPITDDAKAQEHYLTVKGDIFHLHKDLHTAVKDWSQRFPKFDKYEFFAPESRFAFSSPNDMFRDIGFDMALFNWHTFCEIGDPDNQEKVLHQIQNVLWPGGELVIEIPDRTKEPYVSVLDKYYKEHKTEGIPYGTLREIKPDGSGEFSARYFPGKDELLLLLKRVGFEVDEKRDVQTYDIKQIDEKTEKEKPPITEYFITARKSKH